MTDYTIVSAFRNKEAVNKLVSNISKKGFSCYNFTEKPADPDNPDADPEEQMKKFESTENFLENPYFKNFLKEI